MGTVPWRSRPFNSFAESSEAGFSLVPQQVSSSPPLFGQEDSIGHFMADSGFPVILQGLFDDGEIDHLVLTNVVTAPARGMVPGDDPCIFAAMPVGTGG